MESRTKLALTEEHLTQAARSAFGSSMGITGMVELADGFFNTAWLLKLSGNGPAEAVLKVGPLPDVPVLSYEKDIIRSEIRFQELLHPGVPVPEVYFKDFSRSLIPSDYYFMECISGETWYRLGAELTEADHASITAQLARILKLINARKGTVFGYDNGYAVSAFWRESFMAMIDLLFSDGDRFGIIYPESPALIRDRISALSPCLDVIQEPSLVHWDSWEGNVFVKRTPEGPVISALIDFERCLWGDPLMEVNFMNHPRGSAFDQAYGPLPGSHAGDENRNHRRTLYNIYLALVIITEDGPRQYPDKGVVYWAKELFDKNYRLII